MSYNQQSQPPYYAQSAPNYQQQNYQQQQQNYQQQNYQQQNQPAYYAPPAPNPYYPPQSESQFNSTTNLNQHHPSVAPPKKEDRFKPVSAYKDVWAAVLFVIILAGFGVSAFFGISKFVSVTSSNKTPSSGSSSAFNPNARQAAGILGTSVAAGFAFSLLYFLALQKFAGKMIIITLAIAVLIKLAIVGLLFYLHQPIPAVIMAVFVGLFIFIYWSWRSRFPFAKVMLKTVCSITSKYPSTIFVAVVALIVQTAFLLAWVLTLIGINQIMTDKKISSGATYAVGVFLVFILYWFSQIIANSVHLTVTGLFATYYFMGVSDGQGKVTVPVQNPTLASAKRAMTTSFGSNCFGSLLIAILQTIEYLVNASRASATQDGNAGLAILLCCIECCLSLIRELLEYFNRYAFAYVAIYGKDFVSAAKDTWTMIKSRGIDAIINDSIIGNVLGIGALMIGLFTGGISLLFVLFSDLPKAVGIYVIVGLVGFFVGVTEFSVVSSVIDSGVVATFVCLAEDPNALQRTKPELFSRIQQVYPGVIQTVFV